MTTDAPVLSPEEDRPRLPIRRALRRRRYPAGRAIAVVLLTLLFAALLDADSLVASVSSERFGTARSIELALVRPFRTVSDALWLDRPHRWLADLAGTNQPHLGVPSELPVSPVQAAAIGDLLRPGLKGIDLRRHRPALAKAAKPAPPRAPTAAAPLRVWLAGDSLMGMLADAFLSHVAGNAAVIASSDVQIGTGLARPDVYNWPGEVALALQQHPSVVVLTFGANDDQAMASGSGYVKVGTPGWQAEYTQRVAGVMSQITSSGALLVWVVVPPVDRPQLQQNDQVVNAIVHHEAALHPGVLVLDPGPVVAPGGTFSEYLPGAGGQPVEIRAPDGVHLTPAGADRVLPLLLADIRTRWLIP